MQEPSLEMASQGMGLAGTSCDKSGGGGPKTMQSRRVQFRRGQLALRLLPSGAIDTGPYLPGLCGLVVEH